MSLLFTYNTGLATLRETYSEQAMNNDLIAAFNQFFELVHADTDELRMQVYLLRYQVYVLETGFESDADCRSGADENGHAILWEQDAFDERSDHYLLRHRRTGVFAATARLILPSTLDVAAPYPIELHCPLENSVTDPTVRARLGEISRFAVSKVFKRRIGELGSLAGVAEDVEIYFEEDERRVLPHISLGLFAAVMRMVHEHHITHCYAVMEPALLRLLSRFGMVFNRIGSDVDYHGIRVPCITTAEEALPSIKKVAPSVWDLITNRGELLHQPH
jgi:N-acyl amino acid synthase of PEP-CTERM/exosortase system